MAEARPTVLVTGAGGQIGHALLQVLAGIARVEATDAPEVDLRDQAAVTALVRSVNPQLIINPAAYTAVDKAEAEEALAQSINCAAAAHLAAEAARLGAGFIHYSTDYVFDGSGSAPRTEDAPTAPLNAYGRTKLAGEQAVLAAHPGALVLRTSWVYGDHGANFLKTMLKLGAERERLAVVGDQIGAPTSAQVVASMTARAMRVRAPGGIYHLSCGGETSWHGFAVAIFKLARQAGLPLKVREVSAIATEEWPAPARRPKNSRLDCRKFLRTFAPERTALPPWEEALAQVMHSLTGAACLSP